MDTITRVLKFRSNGSDIEVPVRIFWPLKDKTAWFCRWEILWPDRKRSNSAGGIDATQALLNALQMVGTEIYCSDEHKSGRLFWTKDQIGYGFPVPGNIRNLLVGDDQRFL